MIEQVPTANLQIRHNIENYIGKGQLPAPRGHTNQNHIGLRKTTGFSTWKTYNVQGIEVEKKKFHSSLVLITTEKSRGQISSIIKNSGTENT